MKISKAEPVQILFPPRRLTLAWKVGRSACTVSLRSKQTAARVCRRWQEMFSLQSESGAPHAALK